MNRQTTKADIALEAALQAFHRRDPLVVVRSPPGGGKSGTIVRAAVLGFDSGERVLVGAQSQGQALELARSLSTNFSKASVHFLTKFARVDEAQAALTGLGVRIVSRASAIPAGRAIVIANTSKWAFVQDEDVHFDAVVIDEAYQMRSALFDRLAGLGDRYFLVGDPGQIAPIVRSDVRGFRTRQDAPHRAAPEVALYMAGVHGTTVTLPVSRRLVDDSATIIQSVFYPGLPFEGLTTTNDRRIDPMRLVRGLGGGFLDLASSGRSLIGVRLAESSDGIIDTSAIAAIDIMVAACIGQRLTYGGTTVTVEPRHIGVVCARTSQVSVLQAVLPPDVFVETANRMQGLERPIIFAWHPASGVLDPSDFHLEIGRLCVALSRHTVVCALVYRSDVEERLHGPIDLAARSLAAHESDVAFKSLRAHQALLELLREREVTV